jgi:ammonia channel protein AmtB
MEWRPGTVTGLLYGGGASQLTAEVISVVPTSSILASPLIIFKLIDMVVGNRVSAATEEGLDIPEMGSIGHQADDEAADGPLHAKP